jgi:hypothetical protein
MILYTDYPIIEFGDKEGKKAPIRRCKIINYDGDKYCEVEVIENNLRVFKEIKRGYIYNTYTRYNPKYIATKEEILKSI